MAPFRFAVFGDNYVRRQERFNAAFQFPDHSTVYTGPSQPTPMNGFAQQNEISRPTHPPKIFYRLGDTHQFKTSILIQPLLSLNNPKDVPLIWS